jgi:hypothetical protein
MRLILPTRPPAPPRPREPLLDPEPATPPVDPVRFRLTKPMTALLTAGVLVVLLCFGIGLGTDLNLLKMGSGSSGVPREAENADTDKVAADRAMARKMAAAKAADARAAEERAAKSKAAQLAAARKQVVAMPALVGLKLDAGMDRAADAGLTAVAVCRTPDGDTPLWWSNWRITGQDVPAGTRINAGAQVCLSATK